MIADRATNIKLLILDVDGVMTNGHIIINELGEETKCFDAKDGQGLKLLIQSGIEVVIISGRKSKAVEHRAMDLGIREIYQGVKDKEPLCIQIIQLKKLEKDQVCCMGDDLPDLPLFNQAGLSIAVADAALEVRNAACFVTKNRGGNGAIREVCELILKAQKKWPNGISAPTGKEK